MTTKEYNAKIGAADVHVDHRTRNQHLKMIAMIAKTSGNAEAICYWLRHCPRISRSAMQAVLA